MQCPSVLLSCDVTVKYKRFLLQILHLLYAYIHSRDTEYIWTRTVLRGFISNPNQEAFLVECKMQITQIRSVEEPHAVSVVSNQFKVQDSYNIWFP